MFSVLKKLSSSTSNKLETNYFDEAKTWYEEKYESIESSRNLFRFASFGLFILNVLLIVLLLTIIPLKDIKYHIIEVNKETGEIDVIKPLDGNTYQTNWVMNRFFIKKYIESRESYSSQDIKRHFNIVLAMSNKQIGESYSNETMYTNPKSPINLLKNDFFKEVNVISVNQLNDNTALVKYQVSTHNLSSLNDIKKEDFQTVIKWEYANLAESLQDRDQNPLGFYVTYYQTSPVFVSKQ